jgi:cardiolipin synthase (CMP-forming)
MRPMADSVPGEDRILTVPNLITLVRLLCIPWFLWLLFVEEDRLWAAALLAVLGSTDWVDGYVARHTGQVSNFGKVFDPTVDRLLLIVGVLSIIVDGSVPLWLGIVVVAREVILSAFVVVIMALGAERMDVTWFGKAGTFGLMVAFPSFLAANATDLPDFWVGFFTVLAWGATIPGLVFSFIAFFGYFPRGIRALREGRSARRAGAATT